MKKLLAVIAFINLAITSIAQICGTPGVDGSGNISSSINTYFPVSGDIILAAGSRAIQLAAVPANDPYGNNFGIKPISAGDMLLIIQMQDASINASDDHLYGGNNSAFGPDNLGGGGFTDLGNTGLFEYVIATNAVPLTGGNLTFKGAGPSKGIVHTYYNAAATATRGKRTFQVVRIPQYSNLKLESSILTPPFNGVAGGIIAFDVSGTMDFNGFTIDASARGFRGGFGPVGNSLGNISSLYMTNSTDARSVGKGEGVAGTPRYMWDGFNQVDNGVEGLPGGSYGKGAPGNAGGGGNDHNAGGGGGGNGGFGGAGGNGTSTVTSAPNTFPNGGRPGSITYTSNPDITRMIMGGGGGGGDANDALNGVKGGVGGGIVLVNVGRIIGQGIILANGGDGAAGAQGNRPDGAGGGGAGGTVYIKVTDPDPAAILDIQAKGGNGGNTKNDRGNDQHGPGGGGGGGLVLYAMSKGTLNIDFAKGSAGKTDDGAGTNHAAENGTDGRSVPYEISNLPGYLRGGGSGCFPQLSTTLSEANPSGIKYRGSEVVYTIRTRNFAAGGNSGGTRVEVQLSGMTYIKAVVAYNGDSAGPATLTNLGTDTRPVFGDFNISPADDIVITLTARVGCSTPPSTYNASAQALYLDPTRTFLDPDRRITAFVNAFPGSNTSYQSLSGIVPGSNFSGATSSNDNVIVQTAPPLGNNVITTAGNVVFCVNTSGDLIDPFMINGTTPTGDIGIYTFKWQSSVDNISFTDIASATSKDFDPEPIRVTTFYRRIVTGSVCTSAIISNVIKVTVSVVPVAAFESPDFCLNDAVAMFTNKSTIANGTESTLTYLWDFGEPVSGPANTSTQKNGSHVYSAQGLYTVKLTTTSADGCSNTASQQFLVNGSVPRAAFSIKSLDRLCSNSPVEFKDEATVDFGEITKIEWYFDYANNPAMVIVDPEPGLRAAPKVYTHTYPVFATPATKTFEVRMVVYSGGTCVNERIDAITVHATPEIEFPPISPVCVSQPAFQIPANVKFGLAGNGVFSGNGISATGLFDPILAGAGTHTITYTFTATGECMAAQTQDIIVHPSPEVNSGTADILRGQEVVLPSLAASTGLTYHWSPASSLSSGNVLNPIARPEETTTYILTVTDQLTGCTAKDSIKVTVNQIPNIPNTFTPNGDGINDYWIVEHLETYTDCSVKIFNRYGNEVFRSIGYTSPWNGQYQGKDLPSGTYYYIIDPKKGRKPVSGAITILR